jgi:hypothetical protein
MSRKLASISLAHYSDASCNDARHGHHEPHSAHGVGFPIDRKNYFHFSALTTPLCDSQSPGA